MSASENPYLQTLPQLMSAKKKIGHLASFYDHEKTPLSAFDCEELNPTEFREQLRRTFGIELSNAELGAIVMYCDKDNSGKVKAATFKNEFFRLGKQERLKNYLRHHAERQRIQATQAQKRLEREQRMIEMTKFKMASVWTKEEEESAIKKISEVASSYDPQSLGGLGGFVNGGELTPTQFREQLKRNFQIYLSAGELAAVFDKFDSDKSGTINCSEFLFHFFRMGRNLKEIHFQRQQMRTTKLAEKHKIHNDTVKKKMEEGSKAKLVPHTEEDRLSFEVKLYNSARNYEKKSWLGRSVALDGVTMTPTVFKEQLKQNFEIPVTSAELDAAVKWFSRDNAYGEDLVDTRYFISTFFRISQREKSKMIERFFHRKAMIEETKRAYEEAEREKLLKANETAVEWPVLPEESLMSRGASAPSGGFASRPGSKGTAHRSPTESKQASSSSADKLPPFGNQGSVDSAESAEKRHRASRKMSMMAVIDPLKEQRLALQGQKSFGALFPRASDETRSFLDEIERKEKEIKTITLKSLQERNAEAEQAAASKPVKTKKKKAKTKRNSKDATPSIDEAARLEHSSYDQEGSSFFATEGATTRSTYDGFDTHNNFERPASRSGAKGQSSTSSLPAVGSKNSVVFQESVHQETSDEDRSRAESPPNDAFQNISLDDFGKNDDFIKKRVVDGVEQQEQDDDTYDADFEG